MSKKKHRRREFEESKEEPAPPEPSEQPSSPPDASGGDVATPPDATNEAPEEPKEEPTGPPAPHPIVAMRKRSLAEKFRIVKGTILWKRRGRYGEVQTRQQLERVKRNIPLLLKKGFIVPVSDEDDEGSG